MLYHRTEMSGDTILQMRNDYVIAATQLHKQVLI